jgi:hypothetical protein
MNSAYGGHDFRRCEFIRTDCLMQPITPPRPMRLAPRVAVALSAAERASARWRLGLFAALLQVKDVEATARSLRIRLLHVEARGPAEFESAFAAMARERADALLVTGSSTFLAHRARLAELAMKGAATDDVELSGKRRGGWPEGSRGEHGRFRRTRRRARGQDPQGREARTFRSSSRRSSSWLSI